MTTAEIYNLLFNGGNYSKPYLIKLSHPDMASIRLVNNNENILFEDQVFKASTFQYIQPNNKGDSGSLEITSIDNEGIFEFVENADYRYTLEVVGIIDKSGEIQKLKVFRHFYGSISMGEDWKLVFNLGKDDRLGMKFTPYVYDTAKNPGNA